jgi:hypothetical protein
MRRSEAVIRGAARGAIASMAMSGMRRVTTTLGLIEQTPPESLLKHRAPQLFYRVPVDKRPVLVEAAHWSYGALGGVIFGLLPRNLRRRQATSIGYGIAVWALFEVVFAPAFGMPESRKASVVERVTRFTDHVLYGMVVGASPWPHED